MGDLSTYSSLSLLPRFVRLMLPSSGTVVSSLLASMARRNCSSSSYAASRLFMVDRRFDVWEAEAARGSPLEAPFFGERVPSFATDTDREDRDGRLRGKYAEYR